MKLIAKFELPLNIAYLCNIMDKLSIDYNSNINILIYKEGYTSPQDVYLLSFIIIKFKPLTVLGYVFEKGRF